MGISNVMAHWFERLHHRRVFAGKHSILELGPQDLVVSKAVLANFVNSVTGSEKSLADTERKFFENERPRWWTATRDFYALLGLDDYHAIDLDDQRADYPSDLNGIFSLNRRFDVITDFGTAEHLFNIANAMKLIHDHLELGGVVLHVLPTRGDYNHGFFNIHSTFYRDLAAANRYEIVDLLNIPDFGGQHDFLEAHEQYGDKVPRKSIMSDIRDCDDLSRDLEFAKLVLARGGQGFDYVFAALRKTVDAEFVSPQQLIYTEAGFHGRGETINRDERSRRFVARLGAALAYIRMARWPDAEKEAQAALLVEPGNSDALQALGVTFANSGRVGEAIEVFRKVCELLPAKTEPLLNLGFLLRAVGRRDEAIACFRRVTAFQPGMTDAHFSLASTLQETGNIRGAISVYRRVLSLAPDHARAREALAAALQEERKILERPDMATGRESGGA